MLEKLIQAATLTLLLHLVVCLRPPAAQTQSDSQLLRVPPVAVRYGK